jgi:hypothetical protein
MTRLPLRQATSTSLVAILATAAFLTGCSASTETPSDPISAPAVFDHIHALAVEPGSEELTVATHEGIYRLEIATDGRATFDGPVGGLDFDPMGFTLGDETAYASGHPGPTTPTSFGSPDLGLITSTDRGKTWNNVSLAGQTDFHDLAVFPAPDGSTGARIFGLATGKQAVQRSLDGGGSWTDGAEVVARDLLAAPASSALYATTEGGLAVSTDNATTFTIDTAAPYLYLIGADPSTGAISGVDVAGTLWKTNAAGQWEKGGQVDGAPQAFTAALGRIYVADDRGIAMSTDLGSTWTVLELTSD